MMQNGCAPPGGVGVPLPVTSTLTPDRWLTVSRTHRHWLARATLVAGLAVLTLAGSRLGARQVESDSRSPEFLTTEDVAPAEAADKGGAMTVGSPSSTLTPRERRLLDDAREARRAGAGEVSR